MKVFESATKISNNDILFGGLHATAPAMEKYQLGLYPETLSEENTQYIVMAKAIDDSGQPSEYVSNMAKFCNGCTPPPPDSLATKVSIPPFQQMLFLIISILSAANLTDIFCFIFG